MQQQRGSLPRFCLCVSSDLHTGLAVWLASIRWLFSVPPVTYSITRPHHLPGDFPHRVHQAAHFTRPVRLLAPGGWALLLQEALQMPPLLSWGLASLATVGGPGTHPRRTGELTLCGSERGPMRERSQQINSPPFLLWTVWRCSSFLPPL